MEVFEKGDFLPAPIPDSPLLYDHHSPMNQILEGQITRSSLGRVAFIGELYDCKSESLTSRSLLKSSFPSALIQRQDMNQMEFDYKFTESISDRFELLKVETELQVSILLGLVTLKGSGKFLTHEKKTEKGVSCSLVCRLKTISEKFFTSFDEIIEHVDLNALKDPQYTHVVAEVNWGADCILSLECHAKSDSEKQEIQGLLSGELDKIKGWLSVKGGGKIEKEDSDLLSKYNVNIKVCADLVPDEGWPTSTEDFCIFVSKVPTLLQKVNEGRGKPLGYVMIPLTPIRKLAKLDCAVHQIVVRIDESFITSTVIFLEEIAKIKQKLCDFLAEMDDNKKYVYDEELSDVRRELESLSVKEAKLKQIISDSWVLVRSGQKTLKDLIRQTEKFKSTELNLFAYEEFLESCTLTSNRLMKIKNYISKGVIYLGKGEKFESLQATHLTFEFIVLIISSKMEKFYPQLYSDTSFYFLTLADKCEPNIKYVVVDFDYTEEQFFNLNATHPKCCHVKANRILKPDMYSDYVVSLNSNYVQLKQGLITEYIQHKPANRVALEIMCPGSKTGTCPFEPIEWICVRCKTFLEYGFDDHYYCSCGKAPATSFEYRCSKPEHGSSFLTPTSEFLQNALSTLRPRKELNLLILGQSGVGKSTWINSIINYLLYDSFESAKEGGVISVIPGIFMVQDPKTLKNHVIHIGNKNENEKTDFGESATQYPCTYNFLWKDRNVRIIDTPGLGDTRGLCQDKKNLENIIDHIGYLKELHGVCILLRANDNRITPIFAYCIKELLSHLHKSVAKNIVFCFTNSRISLYSPGMASAVLQKLICGIGVKKDLPLGHHNMFCLDNEAFMFLCSLEYPEINHSELLVKSFATSWDVSLQETRRLFETVKNFTPHLLKETISLVTARNRILSLTAPIAECSKTIQMNVAALERRSKDIIASDLAIEELSKDLNFTEIELETEPLKKPRTVCTSSSCVKYYAFKKCDMTQIEYITHCHVECHLKSVTPKTINNSILKECSAMNRYGICTNCGCGWEKHMHLTVSQKRVQKNRINQKVMNDIKEVKSSKEITERIVRELSSTVAENKKEQEFIIQTSVKFGMFLRENAISFYNDSVEDYLKYLIEEEEKIPHKSETDENLLKSLKETLAHYKAEVDILKKIVEKGSQMKEKLTPQDIYDLEQELYNLEINGNSIRKSVNLNRSSASRVAHNRETYVELTKPKKHNSSWTKRVLAALYQASTTFLATDKKSATT